VIVAVALPLLLAVVVAVVAVGARMRGVEGAGLSGDRPASAPTPETGPLALVPVEAPDAGGAPCAALLAALPATLPSAAGPLPERPLADPAPAGARAWAAAPRPAVLRCGLTRPAELAPDSALLEVNGVQWLRLDDTAAGRPIDTAAGRPTDDTAAARPDNTAAARPDNPAPDPDVATWAAVDRPVFVVLTAPLDAGSGPLQAVADAVRRALPATPVAVR
jgi:hypothetical protein